MIVTGELSWTSNGIARVSECGTKQVLELGAMASSPYFRLRRQYEGLSLDGKMPVLVEVEGVLAQSSNSKSRVIEHPRVRTLTKGGCDKPAG